MNIRQVLITVFIGYALPVLSFEQVKECCKSSMNTTPQGISLLSEVLGRIDRILKGVSGKKKRLANNMIADERPTATSAREVLTYDISCFSDMR